MEYKVKWQGYPSSQNTWEPIKNLKNVRELVQDFETRNKDKLKQTLLNKKAEEKVNNFAANLQKKMEETKPSKKPAKTPPKSEPRITRSGTILNTSPEKKSASKTYRNIKNGSGKLKKRKESEEIETEEIQMAEEENQNQTPKFPSFEMTSEEGSIPE